MDLRRRCKNCVVEAMAAMTDLAIGQEPARTHGEVDVDRMDLSLKVATSPSSHACNSSARFGWRARIRSMAASNPTMEATERKIGSSWVSSQRPRLDPFGPPGARLLNRAVSINQVFKRFFPRLSPGELEVDLKGMRNGQQGSPEF